jgi:prophage antirepressor-like protein
MRKLILDALGDGVAVRVLDRDGHPWFAAIDVIRALGLPRRTLDHYLPTLADDERRHFPRPSRVPHGVEVGNSGVTCVSLSGLFKLLLRVDAAAAKPFQDWACRVLLPTLWDRE